MKDYIKDTFNVIITMMQSVLPFSSSVLFTDIIIARFPKIGESRGIREQ